MNEEKEKRGLFFKAPDRWKNLIIIGGLIGIALIFLSSYFPSGSGGSAEEPLDKISAQEYTSQLEENLIQIISHIDGAGEAKVMITLETGVETKYATQEKSSTESSGDKTSGTSEVSYITVRDANGSERALAVTEVQPTVKGVVVVCPGGEEPVVQQRIISAVTTALDISSKRVFVTRLA